MYVKRISFHRSAHWVLGGWIGKPQDARFAIHLFLGWWAFHIGINNRKNTSDGIVWST